MNPAARTVEPSFEPQKSPRPDVMNDPSYATNRKASERGPEEVDTCRICRGEGTSQEPLFYPCKCSGSIKFVHQDCLMEWLSHSQKKYCELCKTPFRFTKLYHPHMPQHLPTSVFFRRAAIHILKYLITWARAAVVGLVWLIILPVIMRVVWRWVFYLGDAGWARDKYLWRQAVSNYQLTLPSGLNNTNSTSIRQAVASTVEETSNLTTITVGSILLSLLGKLVGETIPYSMTLSISPSTMNTTLDSTVSGLSPPAESSLLSDLTFFKSLGASETTNRICLDILEGQIITLAVVAAFILVFLIREWVVQQQPIINMAAQNAENAGRDDHELDEHESDMDLDDSDDDLASSSGESEGLADNTEGLFVDLSQEEGVESRPRPDQPIDADNPDGIALESADYRRVDNERLPYTLRHAVEDEKTTDSPAEDRAEQIVHSIRQRDENRAHPENEPSKPLTIKIATEAGVDLIPESQTLSSHTSLESSPTRQRPNMPKRELSSMATEIRRSLEEGESSTKEKLSEEANGRGKETNTPENASQKSDDSWARLPQDLPNMTGEFASSTADVAGPLGQIPSWKFPSPVDDQLPSKDGMHVEVADQATKSASPSEHKEQQASESVWPESTHEPVIPSVADATIADISESENAAITTDHSEAHAAVPPREGEVAPRPALTTLIYNWLWGDVIPADTTSDVAPNVEHVVEDLADEPPFVRFVAADVHENALPEGDGDGDGDGNAAEENDRVAEAADPDVAAAAAEAGIDINDPDGIEDAEDLEGILELIGMQGPMTGLFQNAIFSVLLIGLTLVIAIGVPYLLGKSVLLLVGSPFTVFVKLPLRIGVGLADVILDFVLMLSNGILWALLTVFVELVEPIRSFLPSALMVQSTALQNQTHHVFDSSLERITNLVLPALTINDEVPKYHTQVDPLWLSTRSHMILNEFNNRTSYGLQQFTDVTRNVCIALADDELGRASLSLASSAMRSTISSIQFARAQSATFLDALWQNRSMTLSLNIPTISVFDDTSLLYWSMRDRISTVLAGYAFLALIGAIYVRRGVPFSSSQNGRRIEAIVTDVLQQAGGIFKVILIISIEMIAFPLYCGILLDIALLPLFARATLTSRVDFAISAPWTAGFVHWFVGTCYMFHFALFVSMCRKIMRKGVLYFIRDPDDPTFHPVRDVLERNVTTQLRKITFSALVYGVLIILCLGGVVWTLDHAFIHVLPVRWTTNQPSLEFPLDLLFYNFLTPLVIKFFRPSDALHSMYEWWFRGCARALRLSDFLFGTHPKDEQQSIFRRTWRVWNKWLRSIPETGIGAEEPESDLILEGRFVRAPAKDQVRIPKGENVFVDVDSDDNRLDGRPDSAGVHGRESNMMTKVYIPPYFRLRISLFIISLWLFAAATGVGTTILPLLLGRLIFSSLIPKDAIMNDIYAFSLGAYIFVGLAYAIQHLRAAFNRVKAVSSQTYATSVAATLITVRRYFVRCLSFSYVYGITLVLLPILLAITFQLYIIIPVTTYFGPGRVHIVHIVQDWVLGFLYGRVLWRITFMDPASRPGRVLAAVVADGYTRPNARLATRCLILPVAVVFAVAILFPALLASLVNNTALINESAQIKGLVFRVAYPVTLAMLLHLWMAKELLSATARWRGLIRDEVYLIGERLHNFGEKKPGPPTARVQAAVEVAREEH